MSDSCELRTIRSCTPKLETALQGLDRKLVHFLCAEGFITDEVRDSILTPGLWSDTARAGELVKWIRIRVDLQSSSYHSLVEWFQNGGKFYQPIVTTLTTEFTAALPTSAHNPLPQDVPQEVATLPGKGSGTRSISPSAHENCNAPAPAATSTHLHRTTPSAHYALDPASASTQERRDVIADAEIGTGGDALVPSSVPDDGDKSYDNIVMGPSTMHDDDPSLTDSCTNYRAMLNEYCQKNSITPPKYEFTEDNSTGKPLFKCTITCLGSGKRIIQDSGIYFSRKDDAKEKAAQKVLNVMKGEHSQSTVDPAAPNISWKSKLKEHYDKQGKPGMELKYGMTELDDNGFVASVFIPELGKEVNGVRGKTKKEAEQNAAKKAMQLLQ